jgi:death-on-curing protein
MTERIDYLSIGDLISIGSDLIPDFRIIDSGLLESASQRPKAKIFGDEAYPDFPSKVAALTHSLARNHALVDGNKRLAWAAARTFCLMNGYDIKMTLEDAEEMIISIATGIHEVSTLAAILSEAIVPDRQHKN